MAVQQTLPPCLDGNDFSGLLHSIIEDLMEEDEDFTMPPRCPTETSTPGVRNTSSGDLPQVYGNVQYALDAYEYLVPVAFVTMSITIVICFTVLFVQYKRVSPISNSVYTMLCSITLFNFLTIASSFAEHTYLYSKKSVFGLLPYAACKPLYNVEKLSQICHSVSVWLTAAMCVQKTICICRPFLARRIVSMKATIMMISASTLIGLSPFIVQFFDSTFHAYALTVNGQPFTTCKRRLAEFITDSMTYQKVMAWLVVMVTRIVPCVVILIMSIVIIVQLRKQDQIVRRMSKTDASQNGANQKKRVALLVFFVAVVVFTVEMSTGIVYILFVLQVYEDADLLDTDATRNAAFGIDVVLYISYVVVLMSYCLTPRNLKNFKKRLSEIRSGSVQTESLAKGSMRF